MKQEIAPRKQRFFSVRFNRRINLKVKRSRKSVPTTTRPGWSTKRTHMTIREDVAQSHRVTPSSLFGYVVHHVRLTYNRYMAPCWRYSWMHAGSLHIVVVDRCLLWKEPIFYCSSRENINNKVASWIFFSSFSFHLTFSRWAPLPSCLWSLRIIFPFSPVHASRVFVVMQVQYSFYNSSTNG